MGSLNPPSIRPRGYTLVELLVVFTIVGIVIGAASLAWREEGTTALDAQARRLASRIELAMAQNQTAGRRLAVSLDEHGYAFWERDDEGLWVQLPADEEPRGARLPDGTTVERVIFGARHIAAGERLRLSLIDPVPLRIVLRGRHARHEVSTGDFAGRMHIGALEPAS